MQFNVSKIVLNKINPKFLCLGRGIRNSTGKTIIIKIYLALKTRLSFLHLRVFTILCSLLLLSQSGFSQNTDPGGDPDRVITTTPPAVPFSSYMHLILIAAGVAFAVMQLKRLYRKRLLNH